MKTGGLLRYCPDSLLAAGVHRTPVLPLATSHTTVCCGIIARAPRAGMLREQRFCHQEEVFGCGTAEALEAEEVEVPARDYPKPAA